MLKNYPAHQSALPQPAASARGPHLVAAGSSLRPVPCSAETLPAAAALCAQPLINLANGRAVKAISRLQRTRSSSECPLGQTPAPMPLALGGHSPPRVLHRAGGCVSHQNHQWSLQSRRASPCKCLCKATVTKR